MTAEETRERKQLFQTVMVAADDDFYLWVASWLKTQALAKGTLLDWPVEPAPAVLETKPIAESATQAKWVPIMEAPAIGTSFVHNDISIRLLHNSHIQYVLGPFKTLKRDGYVVGFTNDHLVIKPAQPEWKENHIPYDAVLSLDLNYYPHSHE